MFNNIFSFAHVCKRGAFGDVCILRTFPEMQKKSIYADAQVEKFGYYANIGLFRYGLPLLQHIADAIEKKIAEVEYEFAYSEKWLIKPIITKKNKFCFNLRNNSVVIYLYRVNGKFITDIDEAKMVEAACSQHSNPFRDCPKQLAAGIPRNRQIWPRRPYIENVVYYSNCSNVFCSVEGFDFNAWKDFFYKHGIKHTFK